MLVAVDFSDLTPIVVEQAARLGAGASTGLTLLHVGPPEADFLGQQIYRKVVADEVPEHLRESYAELRALEQRLRGEGLEVDSILVQGKAIESILEEARRIDAEMIVIGSHKAGIARLLGSTSEGVLRGTHCPVLVVPAPRKS
jgi:nucleotide-binding universal stress UspA family protein